jgi:hypothetical protein
VDPDGKASLTIGSVVNHRQRASWDGELRVKDARLENGRWIVPGSVYLFTVRGMRSIDARTGGKSIGGFIVPLPGRPGRKFEEWSQWEPRPPAGRPAWPDTNPSYRFRVQRIEPPPPPPDPEQVEAERFAALPPDARLQDYLSFMGKRATEERLNAIMKVVEERSSELARLIGSSDEALRESALEAVPRLATVKAEIRDAILAEGRAIAEGIRAFNQMKSDHPQFYNVQVSLRSRFNSWKHAWWATQQKLRLDGRPPVQEIYDLAVVRARETSMDEIEINARVILEALKPPAPTVVEAIPAATSGK